MHRQTPSILIEYAVQLLHPHAKKDIRLLESVQKLLVEVLDMEYDNILHSLNLLLSEVSTCHANHYGCNLQF